MATVRRTAVTLHDVAREAGVSLATASRALNGSARTVNDEYRQRVAAAALKLNYTTNLSAQAVAKGSTTELTPSRSEMPSSSSEICSCWSAVRAESLWNTTVATAPPTPSNSSVKRSVTCCVAVFGMLNPVASFPPLSR